MKQSSLTVGCCALHVHHLGWTWLLTWRTALGAQLARPPALVGATCASADAGGRPGWPEMASRERGELDEHASRAAPLLCHRDAARQTWHPQDAPLPPGRPPDATKAPLGRGPSSYHPGLLGWPPDRTPSGQLPSIPLDADAPAGTASPARRLP